MHRIAFTPRGERELAAQSQPLRFAKPLVNLPPSTHRFRIGVYRISFYLTGDIIFVERIESRGQAYRR